MKHDYMIVIGQGKVIGLVMLTSSTPPLILAQKVKVMINEQEHNGEDKPLMFDKVIDSYKLWHSEEQMLTSKDSEGNQYTVRIYKVRES